ncbi:MAG: cytochrome c3 family protein [Candidatus Neomarinimicrobiota bacterium]
MKRSILFFVLLFFMGASFIYSQNFYLGVGTPADPVSTSCASCHSTSGSAPPTYNDWITTRHSVAQDSATSPFFGYSCLKCHNTGWDIALVNYGADEYVDSTDNNGYMVTDQVNWDRVKNVQCEQCHGPLGTDTRTLGGDHWTPVNTPNYAAELCGQCHQDSHHPQYEEWSVSKHSTFPSFIPNWTDRSVNGECYKCHHAQDFVASIEDPNYDPLTFVPDGDLVDVDCVACHDPHSNANPSQLRFPVTGSFVVCDACHTVDTQEVDVLQTPHHTTSECLSGTENFGYQYPGESYQNSPHTFVATERCINCHVNMEGEGEFGVATGHTFLPRTIACADAGCHGDSYYTGPGVDTSNVELQFNYKFAQHITDSLMEVLESELLQRDSSLSHVDTLGFQYNAALYNLESVQNEGSRGVHNTKLVHKLLQDAIDHFDPTDVEVEEGLPIYYELSQNYPNPFNPSTQINFSIPEQSIVSLIIYDAIGNEIAKLVDNVLAAGNYKVDWNAEGIASGVYLYRLQTDNFVATKKMILMR